MKKRLVSFFACMFLALSCVILAGCKGGTPKPTDMSGSAYVGTWIATKASFAGEETTVAEVMDGDMSLELNADGTAKLYSTTDVSEGVWTETGKGVKLQGEDLDLTLKDNGGVLEADIFGFHLFFEKQ